MSTPGRRRRWEAAYLACDYVVLLPAGELVLRPGLADPESDRRLVAEARVAQQWALITPCNPGSAVLAGTDNLARLGQMRSLLEAAGYGCRRSVNRDPAGRWQDEPGWLLCDVPEPFVRELAGRFEQNAYLAGAIGAPPALVWLAD